MDDRKRLNMDRYVRHLLASVERFGHRRHFAPLNAFARSYHRIRFDSAQKHAGSETLRPGARRGVLRRRLIRIQLKPHDRIPRRPPVRAQRAQYCRHSKSPRQARRRKRLANVRRKIEQLRRPFRFRRVFGFRVAYERLRIGHLDDPLIIRPFHGDGIFHVSAPPNGIHEREDIGSPAFRHGEAGVRRRRFVPHFIGIRLRHYVRFGDSRYLRRHLRGNGRIENFVQPILRNGFFRELHPSVASASGREIRSALVSGRILFCRIRRRHRHFGHSHSFPGKILRMETHD